MSSGFLLSTHRPGSRPWARLAFIINWTGEPVGAAVVLATLVAVFLWMGNPRAAALVVAGTAAAVAVTAAVKPLAGRTIVDEHLSFPSGHTAAASAACRARRADRSA